MAARGRRHPLRQGREGRSAKDGDWRGGYVLVEVTAKDIGVEFVRVEYDVEAVARGIRESDLPDEFAEYVRSGGHESRSGARSDCRPGQLASRF